MAADPRDAARPSDAYAVLELDPTATSDDIRRAYRRLARALHPDANPGDAAAAERFRSVADAHALLSDPLRRARYDVLRGYARSPVGPRPVRQAPSPSGNTAVRGPAARPSHHPSHRPRQPPVTERPRETDEWSFLGRFVRWAAVALIATALAVLVLLIAAPRAEPAPPPQTVPRGEPGGVGFCQVPEGWVACQLVTER